MGFKSLQFNSTSLQQNQYIIQIHNYGITHYIKKHFFHNMLKCTGCITKSKGQDVKLVYIIPINKAVLWLSGE